MSTILPTPGILAAEVRASSDLDVAANYGVTIGGLRKRLRLGGYRHDGSLAPAEGAAPPPSMVAPPRRDERWMADAACLRAEPQWFFPEGPGSHETKEALAKKICGECPVETLCLTWALAWDAATPCQSWGILGGLNGQERDALRKGKRRPRRVSA